MKFPVLMIVGMLGLIAGAVRTFVLNNPTDVVGGIIVVVSLIVFVFGYFGMARSSPIPYRRFPGQQDKLKK